jgi:hypothetical protein
MNSQLQAMRRSHISTVMCLIAGAGGMISMVVMAEKCRAFAERQPLVPIIPDKYRIFAGFPAERVQSLK